MSPAYRFTPYMLPMLASAALVAMLGIYVWRRRNVPGALPFAIMLFILVFWSLGAALELAAVDLATKIFWVKFQAIWALPATTAELCFGLQYAHLERLLTRRNLVLLSIPPVLFFILALTNDYHHWFWLGFQFDGTVRPLRSITIWVFAFYALVLALATIAVFGRLFIRSPQHRWLVVLVLVTLIVARVALLLDLTDANPFAPMDPTVLTLSAGAVVYALALFGFRMFDPIAMARATVIDQMREGMLVLDTQRQIVDFNPAAEQILGMSAANIRRRVPTPVPPAYADLITRLNDSGTTQSEITIGKGNTARNYALHLSPLKDERGFPLGYLVLLHDMTEQKRAQTQLLEQQRVVATLEERERLARELHDSVGQTLGYVSMQAQAIREWVRNGDAAVAELQLTHLTDIARDAHADIRESILSLKTGSAQEWSLLTTLKQHLALFESRYGITTQLSIQPGLGEQPFEPSVQVQLLRVIKEAMTNARKHGHARCVRVSLEFQDSQAQIVVADDGYGFDFGQLSADAGDHFGLTFMRERMAQIGGDMTIRSQPGAGTQVVFRVAMVKSEQ